MLMAPTFRRERMRLQTRYRWLLAAAGTVAIAAVVLMLSRNGSLPGIATSYPATSADSAYSDLEQQLRRQPRDARAWTFKARADMAAGRHAQAVQAYGKALAVSTRVAKDASVWVEYAEAQALSRGGKLAGEPLASIEQALSLNPRHPQALDLAASAAWEVQDFHLAAQHWQKLQQVLTPDDPRQAALEKAVAAAQRKARLSLPSRTPPHQR